MKRFVVVSCAALLCACAQPKTYDAGAAMTVSAVSGALIGTTVGGMLGGGNGTIGLMIAGGAIGAMAGWSYGSTLMPSDREALRSNTQRAMASARDGEVVSWANPETRVAGTVTPTRSFVGRGGQPCRAFEASIAAREGVGRGSGTACRTEDGAWHIFGLPDQHV
jgi:surface antigen